MTEVDWNYFWDKCLKWRESEASLRGQSVPFEQFIRRFLSYIQP